jgi:hypothetical protein
MGSSLSVVGIFWALISVIGPLIAFFGFCLPFWIQVCNRWYTFKKLGVMVYLSEGRDVKKVLNMSAASQIKLQEVFTLEKTFF